MKISRLIIPLILLFIAPLAFAAPPGVDALTITPDGEGGQTYSVTLQILLFMTLLSVLPGALMLMTSFTRIIIVLAILRQALGTAQTPPNQILVGLALFLTFFIMSPVFNEVYETSLQPYWNEQISAQNALEQAQTPMREFMLAQTRDDDLALFARISGTETLESEQEVPFSLLMPAFATSELKTAFLARSRTTRGKRPKTFLTGCMRVFITES